MKLSKEFACKIPNTGPISVGERIAKLGQGGMFETQMRDATVTIGDTVTSITCEDTYTKGGRKTVLEVPLQEIKEVHTQPLSKKVRLSAAFKKTLIIGVGVSVVILVIAILGIGWEDFIHPPAEGKPVLAVLFAMGCGFAMPFLFYFLPNAVRSRQLLTQFIFLISDNRAFVIAVAPEREAELTNILKSLDLSVTPAST